MWTFGVITDIHFGPEASYGGKLRKLTAEAPRLVDAFARRMRDEIAPDLVFNLGDCIEDASPGEDVALYEDCMAHLRRWGGRLEHVAGNHDRVHLSPAQLRQAWGLTPEGPLYRSFDLDALHVVVLYTHERKDHDITIDDDQLAWLDDDLRRNVERDVLVVMHHSAADQDVSQNRWFSTCPHLCLVDNRRALRARLASHGRVRLVLNGHLHWNHLDVIGGIPYVTLQSLIENVDDDAPGRAAAAHAVIRITPERVLVEVAGAEPCRYQIDRP